MSNSSQKLKTSVFSLTGLINSISDDILNKINQTLSLRDSIEYENEKINLYELDESVLSFLEYISVEYNTELLTEQIFPINNNVIKTLIHPKHGILSRRIV